MAKTNRPWPIAFHPQAFEPLIKGLSQVPDPPTQEEIIAVALTAASDIAAGKLTGKKLGDRRVSGDLSGLYRVAFDIVGAPSNPRFRIVFSLAEQRDEPQPPTVRIIAVGPRLSHLVYQAAVAHKDPRRGSTQE